MFSQISALFATTALLGNLLNAANPVIGLAVTNGDFVLDHSAMVGNANLYQGSLIETKSMFSDLSLTNGLKMRIDEESRGKIFEDRLLLEKGAGQVSGSKYTVTAGQLRVIPSTTNAIARVAIETGGRIEVASLVGSLQVQTEGGIPVANLAAGTALSFSGQASAATPTTVHGKVQFKDGKYTLTDKTTKLTFQLQGSDLHQYVGKIVTATGNLEGTATLQVLNVALGGAAAAGGAAAGGAAAGSAAGLSGAAIAGITVGAAAAIGLGAAAASGTFSSSTTASASR
jgi:hypothetical protein